ncbi:MAG: methyltransferase family protein [Candidatus Thorarchaeota archaeon]
MIKKFVKALVYLTYYNICLLILANSIYLDLITLTIIVLDQLVAFADIMIRPSTPLEDADTTTKIVGILLLLHPFILGILFYENLFLTSIYLPTLDTQIISYIGIIVYMVGGAVVLTSRIRLGRYGDGTTAIKGDHQLLSDGIYKHIRHPLYSGALLGRVGIGLTFRSYFGMILFSAVYLWVFMKRMDIEEETLKVEIGKDYEEYMARTKRLIPHLY